MISNIPLKLKTAPCGILTPSGVFIGNSFLDFIVVCLHFACGDGVKSKLRTLDSGKLRENGIPFMAHFSKADSCGRDFGSCSCRFFLPQQQ